MVILRAADSPHNNQFLYVRQDSKGELGLRMGFVDPLVEGRGVFKRRMKLDESVMDIVYSYTNMRFGKTIGVLRDGGHTPALTLMEPPQSPVPSSDPRMFQKRREPYRSFRLQSLLFKDFSITYTDTGEVLLTKGGSPFTGREGNPVDDEVDGGKELLDLNRISPDKIPGLVCPAPTLAGLGSVP
ncbi:hypothetical protein ACOMHN_018937 [Nucella lapillus]